MFAQLTDINNNYTQINYGRMSKSSVTWLNHGKNKTTLTAITRIHDKNNFNHPNGYIKNLVGKNIAISCNNYGKVRDIWELKPNEITWAFKHNLNSKSLASKNCN